MGNGKNSFFARLKQGLSKTRKRFSDTVKSAFTFGNKVDAESLDMLTEALIAADIGPRAAERMAADVQKAFQEERFTDPGDALLFLKEDMKQSLKNWDTSVNWSDSGPTVWLIAGVNGVGKTTSIAKLA